MRCGAGSSEVPLFRLQRDSFSADEEIIGGKVIGQFETCRPGFCPVGAQQRDSFDRHLPIHGHVADSRHEIFSGAGFNRTSSEKNQVSGLAHVCLPRALDGKCLNRGEGAFHGLDDCGGAGEITFTAG